MRIDEIDISKKVKSGEIRDLSNDARETVKDFVRKNCRQILSLYSSIDTQRLFRGFDRDKYVSLGRHEIVEDNIILGKSPKYRLPSGTFLQVHKMLDKVLKMNNFSALRSNSIFTSTRREGTFGYGRIVFEIFPLDGFTYSWATDTADLMGRYRLSSSNLIDKFSRQNNPFYIDLSKAERGIFPFDKPEYFIKKYEFRNNEGLLEAFSRNNEVLIHGSYVAIKQDGNEDFINEIINENK